MISILSFFDIKNWIKKFLSEFCFLYFPHIQIRNHFLVLKTSYLIEENWYLITWIIKITWKIKELTYKQMSNLFIYIWKMMPIKKSTDFFSFYLFHQVFSIENEWNETKKINQILPLFILRLRKTININKQ